MTDLNQILEHYNSNRQSNPSLSSTKRKMLVGNCIVEKKDKNGDVAPIAVNVPDEMF